MFFTVKGNSYTPANIIKLKIHRIARRNIALYKLTPAEVQLDRYCRKNYGRTLKQICIKLLLNAQITQESPTSYFIIFTDKQLDTLANLITYGNLEIRGSNILKTMFNFNY